MYVGRLIQAGDIIVPRERPARPVPCVTALAPAGEALEEDGLRAGAGARRCSRLVGILAFFEHTRAIRDMSGPWGLVWCAGQSRRAIVPTRLHR
jgi:hypothetical protein